MVSAAGREAITQARVAREHLGVGTDAPLPDILTVVEDTADVPVAVLGLPDGLAGAYLTRRGRPFIFINGNEAAVRERFTLAHEFGHHWLKHGAVIDGTESMNAFTGDPKEVQANYFAAEFLVPERAVKNWVDANDHPEITLETVVRVAGFFGVSAKMACIRMETARVLTNRRQAEKLHNEIDEGLHLTLAGWLGVTDLQDGLAQARKSLPRLPARMRQNALTAFGKGVVDLDRLAALLQHDREEVEQTVAALGIAPPAEEPDY